MLRFLAARALSSALGLLGVAALVFGLLAVAPGDPARLTIRRADGGTAAPAPEALRAFRERYGLDRPLALRFGRWLWDAVRLDLGRSFADGRPVRTRLAETVPRTAALNGGALLAAALVAVPLGLVSAQRRGSRLDRALGVVLDVLFATPVFVTGMLLLLLFAIHWRVAPLFADASLGWRGVALPVAALGAGLLAPIARFTRDLVGSALDAPSALAARARGEGEAATLGRAVRLSAPGFAALAASLVPGALGGSVLVERLFSVRGCGDLLAEAVFARDLPVVLGLTLLASVAVLAAAAAASLASAALDPRTAEGDTSA